MGFSYTLLWCMRKKCCAYLLFLICNPFLIFAFQTPADSLLVKEYDELRTTMFQNSSNKAKAILYAQSYLYKAKKDNDTLKILNGFYYHSALASTIEVSEKYTDSILLFSKNINTKRYPGLGYSNKAQISYNSGNFKKALDWFLKTNQAAKKSGNKGLFYDSQRNISILKSRIGEHETALNEFKECYAYYTSTKGTLPMTYLTTLFALADAYSLNKKLDSASIYNALGYKESVQYGIEDMKHYFTLNEGVNLFRKQNHTTALDSLSKAIAVFKTNGDKANLSVGYFYLGKVLTALHRDEEAIAAHIKVDDVFTEISEIYPKNRESYEILINHYKKLGDKDNQLKYIKQLIAVDSTLHTNYRYLIKNIVQNYDTPKLLRERQEIIENLESQKKVSYKIIIGLVVFSALLLALWLINRRKHRIYKKRFETLYHEKTSLENNLKNTVLSKEKSVVAIPEESISDILTKLEVFEKELGFLEANLSINTLAKRFGTNSKYLSKIINTYKKKSFNYYINDLRIETSVLKLKTDFKFRKYTIKAIANDMGFNTTDAFSRAFYKKNGIQPSYFIRELEKQLEIDCKT